MCLLPIYMCLFTFFACDCWHHRTFGFNSELLFRCCESGVLMYRTHLQYIDPTGTALSDSIHDLDIASKKNDFSLIQ